MGQRLVVKVITHGEDIASIYYHWSAYSVSALEETRKIINWIDDAGDVGVKELRLHLIHMCERNGGGIDGGEHSSEFERIQKMYPDERFKTELIDRNDGLIAITETGIEEMMDWAEGFVVIDLDEDVIYNNVFSVCTVEEYCQDDGDLESIPEIHHDLAVFSINELDHLIEELDIHKGYTYRNGDVVYSLIA